ncbi:hypothetical protein FE257_009979 [Aspergillus nanangensis]|uniref:Zn(2)-C6 fungal-type domain-containing protein n=1 Tax=Aspergillus nanangensis TaxID=2582783 RepID=A0AAD4CW54_ASPNN|nr:hypothetical protein FE257_009979 [Aspergillus nanangensis]
MEDINPAGEFQSPSSIAISDMQIPSGPEPSTMAQPNYAEPAQSDPASLQRVPKKRTKTGCLTCRHRRIKCGEEKPICNNCIKSKRECKGYAQRLIFKNPLGIPALNDQEALFDPNLESIPVTMPLSSEYHAPAFSQPRPPGLQQPVLAPRPAAYSVGQIPSPALTNHYSQYYGQPTHSTTSLKVEDDNSAEPYTHSQTWPQNPGLDGDASHIRTTNYSSPPIANQLLQSTVTSSLDSSHSLQEPRLQGQITHQLVSPPPTYVEEGDDYYDVESEEELEDQIVTQNFNQLNLIMASANRDEAELRSYRTYLNEPNILASYRPSLGSSPLNNPKTARVFLHFIHSTGPSLSIFERHPIDPSTMFGTPVPAAQQGLWTYTLPFKALEHQALLQAILALSSLHISFLQHSPPTVSLKHYHYALKRVGVAVGLPMRRKQVGTLAAALLLAYYEVMSAEHANWNSHVAGVAQLVREIDFAGIARDLRMHRRRTWPQRHVSNSLLFNNVTLEDDPFAEKEGSIDPHLIGSLLGRAVNYDEFGQVDDGSEQKHQTHFSRKDIETFRIQCDLYWCMPYSQWGQCPPRAGIGRLDAIYGSADHIWLLLGRLSDFGRRDRGRKLKALKATGSDWRPGPGLFQFLARFAKRPANFPQDSSSSHSNDGATQALSSETTMFGSSPVSRDQMPGRSLTAQKLNRNSGPGGEVPTMYGMIPSTGPRRPPAAFARTTSPSDSSEDDDEDGADTPYDHAEREWESILLAFNTFAHALGPHFMPLPTDSAPPIFTPFGPAAQYRTHTVAVLWGFYYLGLILLYRTHPSMPPAMMVAAGVASPATIEYSQIIGTIASGIYYPQVFNVEAGSLSPTLGSCLIEITVPLFFAAVQYTDTEQREWVVTKLRSLSYFTGWKSSEAIAAGCERAWISAAQQGRGPPYESPSEHDVQPHSTCGESLPPNHHNSERRFITVSKPYKRWAMGLLSLEDDIINLEIEDRV